MDDEQHFPTALWWGSGVCVIAPQRICGEAFPIYCVDVTSGRVIWTSQIWCSGIRYMGRSGLTGRQIVEMRANRGQLFVFGVTGDSVFLESMELKTGTINWRFGSSYCD